VYFGANVFKRHPISFIPHSSNRERAFNNNNNNSIVKSWVTYMLCVPDEMFGQKSSSSRSPCWSCPGMTPATSCKRDHCNGVSLIYYYNINNTYYTTTTTSIIDHLYTIKSARRLPCLPVIVYCA